MNDLDTAIQNLLAFATKLKNDGFITANHLEILQMAIDTNSLLGILGCNQVLIESLYSRLSLEESCSAERLQISNEWQALANKNIDLAADLLKKLERVDPDNFCN